MTYDASDRKSVRKAEKAARQSERGRQEVIVNLMSTTFGRQWLWELLTSCHVFSQTFTTDPLMTAFAEGRRSLGLELLSHIMAACPDQYLTAAREANVRRISDDRSTTAEHTGSEDADGGTQGPDPDFDPYADADRAQAN